MNQIWQRGKSRNRCSSSKEHTLRGLRFGLRGRFDQRVEAVEPHERDAVPRCRFAVATGSEQLTRRRVERVELRVAPDAERGGVTANERPVLFAPVTVELLLREVRSAAEQEGDADHVVTPIAEARSERSGSRPASARLARIASATIVSVGP